ncbi:hypothetical protein X975_25440, partial [Stegodyphus mimosarum]
MNFTEVPNTCWTDSSTTLFWIKNEDNWGTFVKNRIKKIRSITSVDSWTHIPGSHNPADLPTRGCSPKFLLTLKWLEGPKWLRQSEDNWPKSRIQTNTEEVYNE